MQKSFARRTGCRRPDRIPFRAAAAAEVSGRSSSVLDFTQIWLQLSGGTFRFVEPAVGRLLVGNAGAGYDFGERRVIVPGDYPLVGYGSMPVELHGREGEGMTIGSQVIVIDLDGVG